MRLLDAMRARLRLLFARRGAESRMDEEFRFHIEMETEKLVREQGLDPREARRRALVAFGGVERHKEKLREERGLAWLGGFSLDLKLGFRMLVKYPGLTVVGGMAMAFAIWVGAVVFEMLMLIASPTLPLPDGDRIVHLRNWDTQANDTDPRVLHDFLVWRESMRSVSDLGAWQDLSRNLTGRDGEARPVQVAAITASGFRVTATPPLLGRALVPSDEDAGAPPVLVLGHDVWQARFEGDTAIVGQIVQLGDTYPTVVGVMPDGFAFPIAHDAWTAFRPSVVDEAPLAGPGLTVFGKLAPGATLADARAELATLGQRAALELPVTHGRLRPQVMPYTEMFSGESMGEDEIGILALIQLFVLMLIVLVCGNVALLLFARAATRENEIVVRSSLGASRRRIVVQLFAEALVLGGVSAAAGLGAAHLVLDQWGSTFLEANMNQIPFWYDPALSPRTVLYGCALTLVAAAIAGIVPGLKVTKGIGSRLRAGTAGGGGLHFGGVWTAVIVAQVAATVFFPSIVVVELREIQRVRSYDVGFAADEYLTVRLESETDVDGDTAASDARRARLGPTIEALRERVASEPGVLGVTFVDVLPRTNYDYDRVSLDDSASIDAAAAAAGLQATRFTKTAFVDPSYFDVLGAPILAGRGFLAGDLAPDAHVAIVDQGFVDLALLGRNPIGRRVRVADVDTPLTEAEAGALPWYEIVGVVPNLGMIGASETGSARGLYRPATPGSGFTPHMLVHTRGDPLALVPRLRSIAGELDPTLRLSELQRLDQVVDDQLWVFGMWLRTTLVLSGMALLLSLAGIYSVLSFAVARRTREIGVRVALGARRRRVLTAIFRRPLMQVGFGIGAGITLIAVGAELLSRTTQFRNAPDAGLSGGEAALLVAYAVFMLAVCLLACVVPTRRALRVEPVVAMRVE